ncbi:DUF1302 domain-containing protein [Marinospirillum alkaliphilum]|uniref:DUF1302 domain-containing protein n=1 Tax=Marinospirillum alkaliphilum DSM 21637 TaxID=1122209 RepID=A0A1K1Z7J3_9GAMM|nr:DUF1302 domain-containing protein [Marinospirillum alkaliphilum]SFX70078.1 Protein of unknown function [Marinospirillum alkaliphilum DSM 21637]
MSQKIHRRTGMLKSGLPRLSLIALAVAGLSQAQAAQFELGDVSVRVDSQIAVGSSWRTQNRNNDYIARGTLEAMGKNPSSNASYQGHSSSNTDDGNMNFDKGDAFSQTITGNHSLSFSHAQYRNYGANLSFRYWYDRALSDLSGSPSSADMVDDWKGTTAFDDAKSGIELMDAYVWGDFDVMGRPAQLIFGRHVLNWGESTFIQGGQNVANPIDVQALRRPGAELRDALLPVTMLSGSITLDDNGAFTLQGYYQLEWQRTRADACGTFFSNNDFASEGCGPVYYQSGISEQNNLDGSLAGTPFSGLAAAYTGTGGDSRDATIAERASDREASNSGQFGIALKWYAEQLNGTEFGFYFQNIHSRLPYAGGIVSSGSDGAVAANAATGGALGATGGDDPTRYFIEFPEDQKVFGISFATLLPSGTAWSGEFTYRPDAPIQINANDVLVRGLLGNLGYDPAVHNSNTTPIYGSLLQRLPSEIRELEAGEQKGYREFDVFQFQTTFLHDFNRVLAADNLRLIGEVGFTYVNDLPSTDEIRFGRSSVYGSWGKEDSADSLDPDVVFADNGYVTEFSWGYRIAAQLEYTNALVGGLTLKPTVTWSHDVSGYGPEPGSQFYEGRKILGTALSAEYMNTYFGSLSYTHYFDTDYWDLDDRNFISLSVGMNY